VSDLNVLYQAIILDHNRRPRNFGELADSTGTARGKNPLCGDEVNVWVKVAGDRIADVAFRGVGCAISRAAASLMTDAVKGKTREEAADIYERFHSVVTGKVAREVAEKMEKPIAVFSGVSKFPVRVKCAVLPWHTLNAALQGGSGAEVTSEREGPDGPAPATTGGGA
jgi:nitrogen fixation NifU-like protein